MRNALGYRKLNKTSETRKALFKNMLNSLIKYEQIITTLPKEIQFAVDYETQFEKSFIEPLHYITEKIKWNVDRTYGTQGTLDEFFV